MTKNEIKSFVSRHIEGQGTNVDSGSVLPRILYAIVDGMTDTQELDDFEEFSSTTNYAVGDIVRYNGKLYRFTSLKSAGEWDATKVTATSVMAILTSRIDALVAEVKTLNDIHYIPKTSISALTSVSLSVTEAVEAGFDEDIIFFLQNAHAPTLEFNNMCVTFNNVEVISEDLVNQSCVFVNTTAEGGVLYKAILSLKTNGEVIYTVTELQ